MTVTSSQRPGDKREALAWLEREMRRAIPHEGRLVFGEGNADARLAIVGEAPGRQEEALGRPFVGQAGRLLDRLLAEHSLKREELWVTNVVKRRPVESKGGRLRTRAPLAAEIEHNREWLIKELEIVSPRIVLCLGNVAARILIESGFRMHVDHGHWRQSTLGAVALATFHPAYLLRQKSKLGHVLSSVRQDLKMVKNCYEQLGLATEESG